jgi:hypothetical protein
MIPLLLLRVLTRAARVSVNDNPVARYNQGRVEQIVERERGKQSLALKSIPQ